MVDSTFSNPDVNTFARMDGLGPQVVGQFLETGPGDLGVPGLWTLVCSAGGAGSSADRVTPRRGGRSRQRRPGRRSLTSCERVLDPLNLDMIMQPVRQGSDVATRYSINGASPPGSGGRSATDRLVSPFRIGADNARHR